MLKLYENIKKFRKALGLTQAELAELVGYTDGSMITKIESGKVDLSRNKVYDFARALKTTPVILMGLDKELEEENKKEILLLARDIKSLDKEQQELIISMIDQLKEKGK